MIDTIVLTLKENMFAIIEHNKFNPPTSFIYKNDLPIRNHFLKCVQNPSLKELKNGIYKPRLTLIQRINHYGKTERNLRMEFSCPKIIYLNNINELEEKDFLKLIAKLKILLKNMGVFVFEKFLINAPVSAIHFSKNIILDDFSIPYSYISYLKNIQINKKLDSNQTDYRNDGLSFKYRANSFEVVFYDKIHDLKKTKISYKRTEDKEENLLQLNILDWIENSKKTPLEILRYEVRLNTRQKILQILKKIGLDWDLSKITFNNLFKRDLSKKVLLYFLEKIKTSFTELKNNDCDDYRQNFLKILFKLKGKKNVALRIFGAYILAEKYGLREIRNLLNIKSYKQWYLLKKELSERKEINFEKIFFPVFKQIKEFKSFKLENC
ncbi:MAG: hypothetical protein N2482_00645 [Patescibacteria group bacterium]|nr:hypothetical protein [Patescibacteria group bacterium]